MITDPMEPGYRDYPNESYEDIEADDLYGADEILCDACEATKESLAGTDSDERPWGSAIGCKACKQAVQDAIDLEKSDRDDFDRRAR